eukprot:GEMP01042203.1.p1 GENE.GEMP01042203.1~~GEMP01042203.1.p1  ORF type:complete len:383 (+),score=115.22 GEMP01042203.1:424-1572(+)
MGARHVQATLADARSRMEETARYCAQLVANDNRTLSKGVDLHRAELCTPAIQAARRFRQLQAPGNTLKDDYTNAQMKFFLARNAAGELVGEPLPPLGYVNDGGFLRPTFHRIHPTPTASVPPTILDLPYSINITDGNMRRGMNPYMTPQQSAKLDLGRYEQADKDSAFNAAHGPIYTPQVALSPAKEKHIEAAYHDEQTEDDPISWALKPMKEHDASLAKDSKLKAEEASIVPKTDELINPNKEQKPDTAERVHKATTSEDNKKAEEALEHEDYDDAVPETEKAGVSDTTTVSDTATTGRGLLGAATSSLGLQKEATVEIPPVIPSLKIETDHDLKPEVKPLPAESGLVPAGADRQEAGDIIVQATAAPGEGLPLPKTNIEL